MAIVILNKPEVRRTAQDLAEPLVDKAMFFTLRGAKRMAPVRSMRPYDKRRTGRLRANLRKRGPRKMITQVKGSVGSTLPYAMSVHGGAQPHLIMARNRPNLVFYWEREAVTFVGPRVNHPGVRESSTTKYLTKPLVQAAARYGFRVDLNTGTI